MFTQASNGVVPTNSNVQMKIERTDGGESGSSSESEDSTIADILDDDDSTIAEDDEECEFDNVRLDEDNFIWYYVYRLSEIKDEQHFLDAFTGLLAMYIASKEDDLYQKIMKDANKLEDDGMKFEEAIAVAILKHKKAITIKSNSCKPSTDEDGIDLWCEFVNKDAEPWCTLFTGEKCSCKDCENLVSLPKCVAVFVYIFHLMDNDYLIQEIVEKLEEGEDILIPTVKEYRKDILTRYASVKDLLSRCNAAPKHARTLVLLWKYINDNE